MEIDLKNLPAMKVFMPYAFGKIVDVIQNQRRFVHYTNAEVAMSIIQNEKVWMRNTTVMNDFKEIQYGRDCLISAYRSAVGIDLMDHLEKLHPGLKVEFENLLNPWLDHFRSETYITCLSEHDPAEDAIGRLSMWRAYGGRNGVAMVINNAPFAVSTDALRAYSSPVAYLTPQQFEQQLALVFDQIKANQPLMDELGRQGIVGNLFNAFQFAIVCTKHPGFREEREWRVIYSPTQRQSPVIKPEIRVVNGVAQTIQMLPLKHAPEQGLYGADVPSLLNHLIIGPSQYPWVTYKAFVTILGEAGVKEAGQKVHVSDIPLRQ
jgi:hypothetical protein